MVNNPLVLKNRERRFGMLAKDRIIVALDVDSLDKAEALVRELSPHVGYFKIGLELITLGLADEVIKLVHSFGAKVFYDGKFPDIPTTVGRAARAVASKGVAMFNVHASADTASMAAAAKNKGSSTALAVTVLTSMDNKRCRHNFGASVNRKVVQFAHDALDAGMDGVICSSKELVLLGKYKELDGLIRVTPGVRPLWAPSNDQKRAMTPDEAIMSGATILVVGRPITDPPKDIGTSVDAAKLILKEVEDALVRRSDTIRERENFALLRRYGAIVTGTHVVLTSGRHGSEYVNKDAIYPHTEAISELCREIAKRFADKGVEAVIAPAVGGLIMAQWTAHHLSHLTGREVLGLYADKEGKEFVIKRGYDKLVRGKKVLVVEDILTTGGSVKKVIEATREAGGNVVGLGALCNRGGVTSEDVGGVSELFALVNLQLETWEEADCPLCARGVPINTDVGKGREFLEAKKK